MVLMLIARVLACAAALVCLWFIVKGLIDLQRINTGDSSLIETQGIVRQVSPSGRFDSEAVLTLNIDDEVYHVDCRLPGPWFGRRSHRVTDLVPVYWQKGDKRAVAAATIQDGQRMFILGFVGLAIAALILFL